MRLDAFLKTSRLIKRRSLAKRLCDEGMVLVGGRPAKPGREVRPGETITLVLSRRTLVAEVVGLPAGNVTKQAASELYRVIEDRPTEEAL